MAFRMIVSLVLLGSAAAAAQDAPKVELPREYRDKVSGHDYPEIQKGLTLLMEQVGQMRDWDLQEALLLEATERVYARNGWVSDADMFSLELGREVASLPPWALGERYERTMQLVSDRYLLTPGQEEELRQVILEEVLDFLPRNIPRISDYALDMLRTRAAGEPFTPEQVARWTELAMPVVEEARKAYNHGAERFMGRLDPAQRDLVEADLRAANARLDAVSGMSKRWAAGQWSPAEWGLDRDPIQMSTVLVDQKRTDDDEKAAVMAERMKERRAAGEAAGTAGGGERAAAGGATATKSTPESGPPAAVRDDPWAEHVRAAIAKYKLTSDQQQSAWRVFRAVVDQREQTKRRFETRLTDVKKPAAGEPDKESERIAAQRDAALNRLLDQLKRRLERLPTRAQREAAASQPAGGKR